LLFILLVNIAVQNISVYLQLVMVPPSGSPL